MFHEKSNTFCLMLQGDFWLNKHIQNLTFGLTLHCRSRLSTEARQTWWRHQIETFSALLAICEGNSPITGEFPAQRPMTRSFDVFIDLRPNKRLCKQWWGWWFETPSRSLWRHCSESMLTTDVSPPLCKELSVATMIYEIWQISLMFKQSFCNNLRLNLLSALWNVLRYYRCIYAAGIVVTN